MFPLFCDAKQSEMSQLENVYRKIEMIVTIGSGYDDNCNDDKK